jgi:hypothetical protein
MNAVIFTHSSVSSPEVKNEQSYASTLPMYFDGIDVEKLPLLFFTYMSFTLQHCVSMYTCVTLCVVHLYCHLACEHSE